MNFDLSEEQQVIADLAAQLFGDLATTDRVKAAEHGDGIDRELWASIADAGLVALCLPEQVGGSGMGLVELALVAEQIGRTVAPVPFVPTVVAAMTLAEHGVATELLGRVATGEAVLTSALAESGANDPLSPSVVATRTDAGIRLVGEKPAVPVLPLADAVIVPAVLDGAPILALVDAGADGAEITPVSTTRREPQGQLTLDVEVPAEVVIDDAGALETLFLRSLAANSALQLGVGEGAVALAAEHVSNREQFGRPLSAFQAVSQRAADGYIFNEAIRSTVLNAAWQLQNQPGDQARADTLAAAYWSSEGTEQVVLTAQHLHGGVGADIDYPVHRYFLWGMQLATSLGTASSHLVRLGEQIATRHG